MSVPIDPVTPTTPPVPSPVPVDGQQATDEQIRALASQMNKPALSFEPAQFLKGVVTAIDVGTSSTPPTITCLLSGDSATPAAGVRIASDYSPYVGDTVIIAKVGAEFFAICKIADTGSIVASSLEGGWVQATLNSGHTHDGNGNGNLRYRRIMEDGTWKMQWRGGINFGSAATICNVPAEFRPIVKVSCNGATNNDRGLPVTGIDFFANGDVIIVAPTTNTRATTLADYTHEHFSDQGNGGYTSYVDPIDSTTFNSAHSHGVVGGHDHFVYGEYTTSRSHDHGSHDHDVLAPDWVTFHNIEYFL